MSKDHDREEQRLRDVLEDTRRAANTHEEPPEDELLHVRPKAKTKKKKVKREEN